MYKNTLSKSGYIGEHVFWVLMTASGYRYLIFRALWDLGVRRSAGVFWGMTVLAVCCGIAMTFRLARNRISITLNVLFPYEIYTLAAYRSVLKTRSVAVLAVAAVLSAVYCALLLCSRPSRTSEGFGAVRSRIRKAMIGGRNIFAVCLLVIFVPVCVAVLTYGSLVKPAVAPAHGAEDSAWTAENNMETICQFRQEEWDALSVEEKVTALQVVANIECVYLGLPHELTVVITPLDEFTAGAYMDPSGVIYVNLSELEQRSAVELLNTIFHEAYHAYQHRLCDVYDSVAEEYRSLLIFDSIHSYKQEFANYTDGDEDFAEYYLQACEVNARRYAESAVEEYMYRIEHYLTQDQEQ